MEWLLATPQISSTFSSLGSLEGDTYDVSPNALSILEEINYKLTYEDQTLRTYRRAIGFGQNVRTDLIPLLQNAKDDDILDLVIRILVNLTLPVECLFSVEVMYRTEVGRHTIFELNKLLYTSKEAFTDTRSTRSVVDFMKHILESDLKLSPQKCDQINNCLVLLRNILHIPETNIHFTVLQGNISTGQMSSMQNVILWNMFIQNIDKLLLYLMTCPQRAFWGVTAIQLIALMYKDQHVCTLQNILNIWFEASLSESSEDNESNTSPPKQGSCDSSPMLTSDPTSDSSDNGGGSKKESCEDRRQALFDETQATLEEVSRKGHEYLRIPAKPLQSTVMPNTTKEAIAAFDVCASTFKLPSLLPPNPSTAKSPEFEEANYEENSIQQTVQKVPHSAQMHLTKGKSCPQKRQCPSSQSEHSDCGYGTQVENQESISTSSNDDEGPQGKPAHQKPPCSSKPRNKQRNIASTVDKKELRRKKLVKRSKSNLINMKGLVQHTPTDEDISNLLKEFTVDFLLKGYDFLAKELHMQLLSNIKIPLDASHFFWLVTYFLKFAGQLELDLIHIHSILNFDIISYLTYEGVMLCEQLELNSRQGGSDIKSCLHRMHLLVTAIREFLQAIETYKKITHLSASDRHHLHRLQIQISSAEDLRCLFVLLLRNYNPNLHTKQYLQDLIVTNHLLLLILDTITKSDPSVNVKMVDHISQFATPEIMHHYGMLLQDFNNNGQFVNDCIFTMMHHIGGDLDRIGTLLQPVILKTYSRIWETDYELCEDWSDLIEYVINKFINTPQKSPLILQNTSLTELTKEYNLETTNCTWTQEEMDTLYWYYVQSKESQDLVGKILKLSSNNGNKQKSRISIIQQLLQQDIITLLEYDDLMKLEDAEYQKSVLTGPSFSSAESGIKLEEPSTIKPPDDFQILRDLIIKENKSSLLIWLQNVLLECCYTKLILQEANGERPNFDSLPEILEPVAYHCIYKQKSIPLVPWNTDQANTMLYQPFLLLLHKLGFQLPVDAGSVFPRIPHHWTAEMMYLLAKKLGPLDRFNIKFNLNLLRESELKSQPPMKPQSAVDVDSVRHDSKTFDSDTTIKQTNKDGVSVIFAVPKVKHSNSIIRFTPDPAPTPSAPNWLQLVMRSKCTPTDRYDADVYLSNNVIMNSLLTPITTNNLIASTEMSSQQQQRHQQQQQQQQPLKDTTASFTNNDSTIKCLTTNDRNDGSSSGFYTQRSGSGNLDSMYSVMVASVYENDNVNSETDSVASDLTRMNVSDDEKGDPSLEHLE